MLEFAQRLDHQVFSWINLQWTNSFFDWFFPAITDLHKNPWIATLLLVVTFAAFYWNRKTQGILLYISLLVTAAFNDWFSSAVIKSFFKRSRPSLSGVEHIMRAEHFNGYSFVSNHAANTFCIAIFVSAFFPKARWPLLMVATLVAYSRVYSGVHFPSDILGGALVGAGIGYGASRLVKIWLSKEPTGKPA